MFLAFLTDYGKMLTVSTASWEHRLYQACMTFMRTTCIAFAARRLGPSLSLSPRRRISRIAAFLSIAIFRRRHRELLPEHFREPLAVGQSDPASDLVYGQVASDQQFA